MYPELLSTSWFTIHSYGFLIVIGFLICLYLIRKKSIAAGLDADKMTDLAFWSLLFGLVGGRVLYVMTLWDQFMQNPVEIFRFWSGGLVYYGGFIGGVSTFIYLSRKYEIPVLKALDIATPSLAIAHAFGRLGCVAAGCCYGKVIDADHPFAMVFNHAKTIAPRGIPLHPAQLYDAANALIIFLILSWLYQRKKFDGQVILAYGMIYAIGRSIVEVYRGDKIRGFVVEGVLSTSQFISLLVFIASAVLYFRMRKKTLA